MRQSRLRMWPPLPPDVYLRRRTPDPPYPLTAPDCLVLRKARQALYFGIQHPDVQRRHPVLFLHDPWLGFFGRRDVLCLWTNAGRRELGLEGFDDRWSPAYRFAFINPGSPGGR